MKARIPHSGTNGLTLDRGGIDIIVPDGRLKIEDFFELDSFSLSKSEVKPFEPVTINWAISPKREDIDTDDFKFVLYGPDEAQLNDIALTGSETVHPWASSYLHIKGRKRVSSIHPGSNISPLGDPLMISVNTDDCDTFVIYKDFFDDAVRDNVGEVVSAHSEIRLRKNNPLISTWTNYEIAWDIPLELVINNFFDADLDLSLTMSFMLTQEEKCDVLDVSITVEVDVDFHPLEDIASIGSSSLVAKMIERVAPLILHCGIKEAEATVLRQTCTLAGLEDNTKRLLSVKPVSLIGQEHLEIIVCDAP